MARIVDSDYRTRCLELLADDYLIVEVGPPAVLPKFKVAQRLPVDIDESIYTQQARLLQKRAAGG